MKNKKTIIMIICLLVIGFASVTTTLVINGTIGITKNDGDFNIIFTKARLDGRTRNDFIDSETKRTINFVTDKLTKINQTTTLKYDVSNTSRIYDAEVSVVCNIVDDAGTTITSEYIEMEYAPASMTVHAGETKTGSITTKLIKGSTEDNSIKVKCTLNANATEREELADEFIDPNIVGGTIMPLTYDDETGEVTSGKIWDISLCPFVTKMVFENRLNPHETTTDLTFDISEAQDGSVMAYFVENSDTLTVSDDILAELGLDKNSKCYDLYIQSDGKIMANADSGYLFSYYIGLKTIEGLEYFDTSNVTNMSSMFCGCMSLTSLDLSNFDTSNVTNMNSMFISCYNLTALNVSDFNTSSVTDMTWMFQECRNLITLDLSSFNTGNVRDMYGMFAMCSNLTSLDVSNFDTRKAKNMVRMFEGCTSLTTLDLSNFNTINVMRMDNMFEECTSLTTLDIRNFDTSKLISNSQMFTNMPANANVTVKDETVQNWILGLSSYNRPTEWTTDNVIIASPREA